MDKEEKQQKSSAERQANFRQVQKEKGLKNLQVHGENGCFDPRIRLSSALQELSAAGEIPEVVRQALVDAAVERKLAPGRWEEVEKKFIRKEISGFLRGEDWDCRREYFDADLNPLLEIASAEDLQPLVKLLTQDPLNELVENEKYKNNPDDPESYADAVADEIRRFGGHSLANFYRGCGPAYREIVTDAAQKLDTPFNRESEVPDIEEAILLTVVKNRSQDWEKMSADEKDALACQARDANVSGWDGSLLAFIGLGGTRLAGLAGSRFAAALTGPLGLGLSALWLGYDLGKTAFRITIPAVIHIALLRLKYGGAGAPARTCPDCGALLPANAKFCPECGAKVTP